MDHLPLLIEARDTLAESLADPPKLELLSRQVAFSPFHFQRLFSQTFGESPAAFVQRLRFERARTLLLSTDQSVLEICFEVGYQSPATFNRQFKSRTGSTPQEFRIRARRCFHVGRWQSPHFIPMCMTSRFGPS